MKQRSLWFQLPTTNQSMHFVEYCKHHGWAVWFHSEVTLYEVRFFDRAFRYDLEKVNDAALYCGLRYARMN